MEPTEPPKRPAETTEDSSEPPAKRQKPSTAPLHGALRRTFLRKHASLLSHLDPAKGLLVTVSTRQEARGLGQFRSFLDKMVEMLLPDAVLEPKVSVRGIDGRDDAPESDEESGIEVGNEDAKEGGAEEHDYTEKSKEKGGITYQGSMIEAVDTGCQGLLFFRLRVKEVDVVGFVGRVFGE